MCPIPITRHRQRNPSRGVETAVPRPTRPEIIGWFPNEPRESEDGVLLRTRRPAPLPRRAPAAHARLPRPGGPGQARARHVRLPDQVQPHLAAAADHGQRRGHRRLPPAARAAMDQQRPDARPAAAQLSRPRALRALLQPRHPPDQQHPADRALPPVAGTVHRLSHAGQLGRGADQGRARRRDRRADAPASHRQRSRRHLRSSWRAGHHRLPDTELPAGVPPRGPGRRLRRDEAADPAARPERDLPRGGRAALLAGARDVRAHPDHPWARPREQRDRAGRRHAAAGAQGGPDAGSDERPVRLAGLDRAQPARRRLPDRGRADRLLRHVRRHAGRRRHAPSSARSPGP